MILSEIRRYFTSHPLLQAVKFYTGHAQTNENLPYVVLLPSLLGTEYTFSTATSSNTARECIDTLDYQLHLFERDSDDLEKLIHKVTNAMDNQLVCAGCMDNERKSIQYSFDDTYTCHAVIDYRLQRTLKQNTI